MKYEPQGQVQVAHLLVNQPKEFKMPDATEPYRRQRLGEINAQPGSREALEAQHGQVWDTEELSRDFEAFSISHKRQITK